MEKKSCLAYSIHGEGMPVLLLHGFLESSSMWESIVNQVKGCQFILVDLPGHGNSNSFENEMSTIPDFSDAVYEVLSFLKITELAIVGHSLGGYVALRLFDDKYNLKINKLVLLNSHPWEDSVSKKEDRLRAAAAVSQNKSLFLNVAIPSLYLDPVKCKTQIQVLISGAQAMEVEAIVQTMLAMRNRVSTVEIFAKNSEKIFVLQGEKDMLIPAAKMEELCRLYSVDYCCLSNSGHMSHEEVSSEVVELLQSIVLAV